MASASAQVVVSGDVGPEAMKSSGSPMTSERMRESTLAGEAASASLPALTRERCFRTVLSSTISAPPLRRMRVITCLSSRERPSDGATKSAEPPPEMRQTTSVSRSAFLRSSIGLRCPPRRFRRGRGVPLRESRCFPKGAIRGMPVLRDDDASRDSIPHRVSERAGHGIGRLAEPDHVDFFQALLPADRADPVDVVFHGGVGIDGIESRFEDDVNIVVHGCPPVVVGMESSRNNLIVSRNSFGARKRA